MSLPSSKDIIPPSQGWEAHTLYLVEVAYSPNNPVHQSYLRVGFLNGPNHSPGAYTQIWNNTYEGVVPGIHEVHYLKVLEKLHTETHPELP